MFSNCFAAGCAVWAWLIAVIPPDSSLPRTHTWHCKLLSSFSTGVSRICCTCFMPSTHHLFIFWGSFCFGFFSLLFFASLSLSLLLNIGNSCHIVVTLLLAPLLLPLLLLSSDNNFALLFFRGGNVASPFVIALR